MLSTSDTPVIEAFESALFKDKVQRLVTVVTRDTTSKKDTETIKYQVGDIVADPEGDVDVVISVLQESPQIFEAIGKVVELIRPKIYIPSRFGTRAEKASKVFPGLFDVKSNHSKSIRDGKLAVLGHQPPADLPDEISVQSGHITPAQVVKLWETRHNDKLEVKATIPKEQALTEAKADWTKNGFDYNKFFYYVNVLATQSLEGDFFSPR
ncbi:hypothetical protein METBISCDRAFT_28274 [Metschnikowia bicuspidata]|uniref:NmrA-like domain-containing protein n=1 Tax=Metschnikowia bicuspidata TaxID=27322 RepID=A0A4P9Z9G1_9ASCO|nr:hypothetical protein METBISCDRAFT_28274 [Metschnikowia bicuspidata]